MKLLDWVRPKAGSGLFLDKLREDELFAEFLRYEVIVAYDYEEGKEPDLAVMGLVLELIDFVDKMAKPYIYLTAEKYLFRYYLIGDYMIARMFDIYRSTVIWTAVVWRP